MIIWPQIKISVQVDFIFFLLDCINDGSPSRKKKTSKAVRESELTVYGES